MPPLSRWQYPSCFRKGQIRQLLRALTVYFYVSSSFLVVWAVDGQRVIQRIPNQFTILVCSSAFLAPNTFTCSPRYFQNHLRKISTFIYTIFKKLSWLTFHFIMCVCVVVGRGNGQGKIISSSMKTSKFFLHGSEGLVMAAVNFYQVGRALPPAPFARHHTGTDGTEWVKTTAI